MNQRTYTTWRHDADQYVSIPGEALPINLNTEEGAAYVIAVHRELRAITPAATEATPETDAEFPPLTGCYSQASQDWYNLIREKYRQLERELAEANLTIRYERDRNLQKVKEARAQPPSAAASSTGAPVREPTQAMLDAGYEACRQNRGAKSVWYAMLDAAPQSAVGAQWIKCSEQMPEVDRVVIVQGGIARWNGEEWMTLTAEVWPGLPIQWSVTHWMPLPAVPTDDTGSKG